MTASLEGSRPLLVELQALVTQTSFGVPRRTTIGVDHNRLALLVAVLEKKVGLHLAGQDIFLNAAGGVRLNEPAADLAMIMAVASSHLDKAIAPQTWCWARSAWPARCGPLPSRSSALPRRKNLASKPASFRPGT